MMLMSFGAKKPVAKHLKVYQAQIKIILELLKVKVWLFALMKALIKPLNYAYLYQI